MAVAYFAFMQRQDMEFIFQLTDDAKIAQARDILSGKEKDKTHVHGRIVKRTQPYNPKWSFYLDPNTINFFEMAIEVCDANMQYVEDHLDEACGAFLPGCHWCPWDSRLTREVTGIGDTVALPVQTTSTAKVQIFADTNFKGKVLTLTDATPDLRTYYFNDTVSSVKVISGTWTFYPHINYESTGSFTPFTLKPGDYATLPGGTNDEISSLKPA